MPKKYLDYDFEYKGKLYRLSGDEFDESSLKVYKHTKDDLVEVSDQKLRKTILEKGLEQVYARLKEHPFGSAKEKKIYEVEIEGHKYPLLPDDVFFIYYKLLETTNFPPLIFKMETYPSGNYRLFVRGDGFKPVKQIACLKDMKVSHAYNYLLYVAIKYFYELITKENYSEFISNERYFLAEEYEMFHGPFKMFMTIFIEKADISSDRLFLSSLDKTEKDMQAFTAHPRRRIIMLHCKEFTKRLGRIECASLKREILEKYGKEKN